MKIPPSFNRIARLLVDAAIMPWIGFLMIVPLVFPLLMLLSIPLRTVQALYAFGFVPSLAVAAFHQLGKPRIHPLLLLPLSVLFGGVACLTWFTAMGLEINWKREPSLFTCIAMMATAMYFARDTLATFCRRRRASLIQETPHLP